MCFQDTFCGAYFTFAITQEGHVYGFGLSNYHQLGELHLQPSTAPACLGLAVSCPVPSCPGLLGGPDTRELEIGVGGSHPA